jgi:hypothetical protein
MIKTFFDMISFRQTLAFLSVLVFSTTCLFSQPQPNLKTIALARVKVNPAVAEAGQAKMNSLQRMAQGMDGQLIDRIHNTRKFEVVARSDADALMEEAGALGNQFAFGDADYLLVVTIDDFQDIVETAHFASLGKTVKRRTIRFSSVGKIYESETGRLIESANFQLQEILPEETIAAVSGDGEISDALLLKLTREMAEKLAQRTASVIYPAKVLAKTGKFVTINRGDGTDIAIGESWEAFAVGEELIDPDTGVSYGREEIPVGMVVVRRVTPKFSQAEITEDFGIDRGAVLRRVVEQK